MLLYVLLGGADFGAGIIEIFTDKKGVNTISKAIAPVWEANHIWLIVIIVILFNAFPEVYSTITQYLHIPIMLALFGIIFRGTAFTFRYYDPFSDTSHAIYTFIFKLFSVFTPFFLGVTLGAVIFGEINTASGISFYQQYIAPWLNLFSISLGLFIVILFAYLASVYLSGEPADEESNKDFKRLSKLILIALVITGGLVFIIAEFSGLHLLHKFIKSPVSIGCGVFATLLLPAFLIALNRNRASLVRIIAGAQTGAILIGWFAAQFPVLVVLQGSPSLTIYNTVAPDKTLLMMIIALFVGLAFVIPLLFYLFKVFKFSEKTNTDY